MSVDTGLMLSVSQGCVSLRSAIEAYNSKLKPFYRAKAPIAPTPRFKVCLSIHSFAIAS